jgi:hypothetical protein
MTKGGSNEMNSKLRVLVLVAVSLALACIPAFGQVLKGSISGTVVDPQAAIVSGAQVKATQLGQGTVFTTTTDSSGLFRFNLIPAGTYKIEVTKQGFKTSVQNDVLVTAGSEHGVGSVKMDVGDTSTTVEVSAEAPLIEATQSQVTNTFSGTTLTTFAGVQENEGLDNLALFVPGVVAARDNGFSNTNGGNGFSVNGLRGRNNDQQIDGQNNNDNSVGGPGLFVSDTEFVQQYVLVTNQFGPEYGRNAGSVVNIITKSGTNAWHGSIYGTENNSILNAMSNDDKQFTFVPGGKLTKPPRLNEEFTGFTIGGPILKNKLFLFNGFDDDLLSTTTPYHTDRLTPTPAGLAQLSGCFPGNTAVQAFTKFGPFGISGGNPVATTVPKDPNRPEIGRFFVPLAVSDGTTNCDNVPFGGISRFLPTPQHGFNFINRADLQLGADTISARYVFNRGNSFNNNFGDAAAGYPLNVIALSQAMLVSWTRNLTSHMVNEARISFNRLNVDFGGNTIGSVPTSTSLDQAVTRVTFRFSSGAATPGSIVTQPFLMANNITVLPALPFAGIGTATNLPQARIVNTWQGQDNWNFVVGKHQFKAGVNYTYQRSPNIFLPAVNGAYRFDLWGNSPSIGLLRTLANNRPDRVQVAQGPSSLDFREHDTFLYGGDDWKISRSLTLNLGLTWSYYGQPANLFNQITTARETQAPPVAFWNPALPLATRTFPTFPVPKNSFGPSVGFAYSPQWGGFLTGNGKTVIRGGYRLLYDPPFYNIYINMATAAPQVFLQTFAGAQAQTHPLQAVPTGPNARASLQSSLTPGKFDPRSFADTSLSPDFGPDKVHSYSLGIEREVTKNSAFEIRYAGNRATNLFQTVNNNPFIADLKKDFPNLIPAGLTPCPLGTVVPGPGQSDTQNALGFGRVNCAQGVRRDRTNTGYSYYNGLQLEFRATNLFKQLTVRTGYTFSKNLDNVSEIFSTFAGGNSSAFAQNPLNFKNAEYGFSGLDIPHQWTISFVEQLPFFKDQHGAIGRVLGGWGLSANYILASGQRYTPSQIFAASVTAAGDYYDAGFFSAFNSGLETARPFLGNVNAPANSVGIFAGDACNLFANTGNEPVCLIDPNQLVSMNSVNTNLNGPALKVTKNDVHYIVNSGTSQKLFGTPFGNTARNSAIDAISNIGNFSVYKRIRLTERAAFEFHTTMLNVFNHFNFGSVDPFVEDAGLATQGTGFANPSVTGAAGRRIIFGGRFSF